MATFAFEAYRRGICGACGDAYDARDQVRFESMSDPADGAYVSRNSGDTLIHGFCGEDPYDPSAWDGGYR